MHVRELFDLAGRTAIDLVTEVADKAGAIIAIGSCASWGGIPSADPNPTGATGAHMVLKGKTVVTIPGCPANPYNLLGTVLAQHGKSTTYTPNVNADQQRKESLDVALRALINDAVTQLATKF